MTYNISINQSFNRNGLCFIIICNLASCTSILLTKFVIQTVTRCLKFLVKKETQQRLFKVWIVGVVEPQEEFWGNTVHLQPFFHPLDRITCSKSYSSLSWEDKENTVAARTRYVWIINTNILIWECYFQYVCSFNVGPEIDP